MGCIGSKYKLSKADLQFLMENTEFTKQQIKVLIFFELYLKRLLRRKLRLNFVLGMVFGFYSRLSVGRTV